MNIMYLNCDIFGIIFLEDYKISETSKAGYLSLFKFVVFVSFLSKQGVRDKIIKRKADIHTLRKTNEYYFS